MRSLYCMYKLHCIHIYPLWLQDLAPWLNGTDEVALGPKWYKRARLRCENGMTANFSLRAYTAPAYIWLVRAVQETFSYHQVQCHHRQLLNNNKTNKTKYGEYSRVMSRVGRVSIVASDTMASLSLSPSRGSYSCSLTPLHINPLSVSHLYFLLAP